MIVITPEIVIKKKFQIYLTNKHKRSTQHTNAKNTYASQLLGQVLI